MASYLILGAGKFGRLALQRLTRHDRAARFAIVDRNPEALKTAGEPASDRITAVRGDAIQYLAGHLPEAAWDWILPMVPEHVAYAWLRLTPTGRRGWEPARVPEALLGLAPLAIRGSAGELYLSRATQVCPDNCLEPEEGCPISGQVWELPLHEELRRLVLPEWRMLVIASRQLAPGVGGYPPGELLRLEKELGRSQDRVFIATACRCHGVVHGLVSGPGSGVPSPGFSCEGPES